MQLQEHQLKGIKSLNNKIEKTLTGIGSLFSQTSSVSLLNNSMNISSINFIGNKITKYSNRILNQFNKFTNSVNLNKTLNKTNNSSFKNNYKMGYSFKDFEM
jgi:hypothetical protein